jgi:hypothetical protein
MKLSLPLELLPKSPSICIEPANDCDGSLCHQPIFNAAGGLNYVTPHFHLVEWESGRRLYYAIPACSLGILTR